MKVDEKTLKVLSCIRVSGKHQIDRTGIPRQEAGKVTICERDSLAIASDGEYRYEGLSGASVEQFPLYRDMLKRLDDPEIAGIVVTDISRLFRPEYVDNLGMTKPFRVHGKLIFYEDGVLDLRKERDQGIFVAEAQKAGAHRKQIIKNTQWGRNLRRTFGNCKTDPLPAGVRFIQHAKLAEELVTGHFEYTSEAARIKEAYRRLLAGDTQAAIARDLKFINPTQLRQYLQSKWWIGIKESRNVRVGRRMREDGSMCDGKRVPRPDPVSIKAEFNGKPPLISEQDFYAAQSIIERRHKTWTQTKSRTAEETLPILGRNLVYCECGRKMHAKRFKGRKGQVTLSYMCSSRANYSKSCGRPILKQINVDREIMLYAVLKLTNSEYLDSLRPHTPFVNTESLKKQLASLQRTKDALYERIGDARFDSQLIDEKIAANQASIDQSEAKLKIVPSPADKIDRRAIKKRFLNFGKLSLDEQKKLIQETFVKIPVDTDGSVFAERIEFRPKFTSDTAHDF